MTGGYTSKVIPIHLEVQRHASYGRDERGNGHWAAMCGGVVHGRSRTDPQSRSKVSNRNPQYFCTLLMLTHSSGECAPRMVGPKEIISISG